MRAAGLVAALAVPSACRVVDYEAAGAKPDDSANETQWHNGAVLNATLRSLQPGDTFLVPNKTFHVVGGATADNLNSTVIQIDGTLSFYDDYKHWPRRADGGVLQCMKFNHPWNVTFTSSGTGTLNGNGEKWWGLPGIGYLERGENRPKLLEIEGGKNILVEHLFFLDSPYWTFWAHDVDGLEVRYSSISARRTKFDGHDIIDLTAFNTDGFDVTGKNIYIHDSSVWNQDDCVCVKDGSENVLVERINASGLGLTIGSIGGSTNRNITFRDCYMHHTYKGIYMKFRGDGVVEDVLYENIVMDSPEQYAIWIGPAQQSDSNQLCAAHPCSICWPELPGAECRAPQHGAYINVTLRNITVNNPKHGPGVLIANSTTPMRNVVFDNVVVNNPGKKPWPNYKCENVQGVATGTTSPVPPCFQDRTG